MNNGKIILKTFKAFVCVWLHVTYLLNVMSDILIRNFKYKINKISYFLRFINNFNIKKKYKFYQVVYLQVILYVNKFISNLNPLKYECFFYLFCPIDSNLYLYFYLVSNLFFCLREMNL